MTTRRRKKATGQTDLPLVKPKAGGPPTVDGKAITDYPRVGICGVVVDEPEVKKHICGHYVFKTPSGRACSRGHGEAPMVTAEEQKRVNFAFMTGENPGTIQYTTIETDPHLDGQKRRLVQPLPEDDTPNIKPEREIKKRPPADFEVREGDRLTVMFNGAKLSIAAYSSVDLDGAIYSRTLEPGDDARAEYDRLYSMLRDECLERARAKLADFADEHAKAKARAKGE